MENRKGEPMPFPHTLPRLLTAAFLIAGLGFCVGLPVEAKSKKGRRATAQSKSKSSRQSARRGKRYRHRRAKNSFAFQPPPIESTVPDSIEVIEYGSTDSSMLARWLNPRKPSKTFNASFAPADLAAPVRQISVRMDQSRVIEIQQALTSRGFYQGEMTGVYDDATIDAMRRFQAKEKISVTGYPTAHALKRLGLAN